MNIRPILAVIVCVVSLIGFSVSADMSSGINSASIHAVQTLVAGADLSAGRSCSFSNQCGIGEQCIRGFCGVGRCSFDTDCGAFEKCKFGRCQP